MDIAQEKMDRLCAMLDKILDRPIERENDISPEKLEVLYAQLQKIYCGNFRHRYSQLSEYLGKKTPDVYSTLNNGLALIARHGKNNHADCHEVNEGIDKLQDHILLESIRNDRMEAVKCVREETKSIYAETLQSEEKIHDEAQRAQESIEHYHEQSIAILGIFSAVVLAFMGGVSFTGGVLESFGTVSFFRLVMTIVLLGAVLINALFVLLEFILQIVYRGQKETKFLRWVKTINIALLAIAGVMLLAYMGGAGAFLERWASVP